MISQVGCWDPNQAQPRNTDRMHAWSASACSRPSVTMDGGRSFQAVCIRLLQARPSVTMDGGRSFQASKGLVGDKTNFRPTANTSGPDIGCMVGSRAGPLWQGWPRFLNPQSAQKNIRAVKWQKSTYKGYDKNKGRIYLTNNNQEKNNTQATCLIKSRYTKFRCCNRFGWAPCRILPSS